MSYREAIASALATVPGVKGHPKRPTTLVVGDAWPWLSSFERDTATPLFYVIRRVMVLLPQDEDAASVWIDEHQESLVDALMSVGFVERMEPVIYGTGQYVLQITFRE